MTRWRLLAVGAMLIVTAMAAPMVNAASHSIPTIITFWDPNDNGVPGPDPDFDTEGPFWSSNHIARLNAAVNEWHVDTDYDPGVANTTNDIFVDGREPPESCYQGTWVIPGVGTLAAYTCNSTVVRYNPAYDPYYLRITSADIYFNMEIAASPDWWVGSGVPPDPQRIDFQGVLTHELGHTVRLQHPSAQYCVHTSSGWFTMCTPVSGNTDSYWYRSLHTDDKEGANYVYPTS